MRDDAARPCNGRADLHMRRLLCPLTVRAARPPRSQRCAVEKPREHAVDANVFCHLTECGLAMVSRGHAVRQVC